MGASIDTYLNRRGLFPYVDERREQLLGIQNIGWVRGITPKQYVVCEFSL